MAWQARGPVAVNHVSTEVGWQEQVVCAYRVSFKHHDVINAQNTKVAR